MELFAAVDPEQVRAHDVGLADGLLGRLGLEPRGQAVVSLPDPDGSLAAALSARGAVVAGRAGRVRIGSTCGTTRRTWTWPPSVLGSG